MARRPDYDESMIERRPRWALRFGLLSLFAFGLAAGTGYLAFTQYQKADQQAGDLAARTRQATSCEETRAGDAGKLTALTTELTACKASAAAQGEKQKADEAALVAMQANMSATRDELETLRAQRAEADKQLAALRDLEGKLKQMIDGGKVTVRQKSGNLVVELPAEVLFPSGMAELSRPGELALMELGVVLKRMPERRFLVVGHTDNVDARGTAFGDNWQLSTARAVKVTQFLISVGMKPENLLAAGHAEFDPVAKNDSADGRQKNRRIEVILLPDLGALAVGAEPPRDVPAK